MILKKYKYVIWDWNGTLLNDVDVAINTINKLLKRRNLKLVDYNTYRNIFGFPVKDYYKAIGFDFSIEPFEKLADEFIIEFNSSEKLKLFEDTKKVLSIIENHGIGQLILSAAHEKDLINLIDKFRIKKYFARIVGLTNYSAESKVSRGRQMVLDLMIDTNNLVLIGDTIHDYEVANEIGCDCILISGGHQSHRRLEKLNVNVVKSLANIVEG
jgi:phosphoglycolate phosphatase